MLRIKETTFLGTLNVKIFFGGGGGGGRSLSGYLEIFASYFKSCGQPCQCKIYQEPPENVTTQNVTKLTQNEIEWLT